MIKKLIYRALSTDKPENPESYSDETVLEVQQLVETARYIGYQALGREPSDSMIIEIMRHTYNTEALKQRQQMPRRAEPENVESMPFFDEPSN